MNKHEIIYNFTLGQRTNHETLNLNNLQLVWQLYREEYGKKATDGFQLLKNADLLEDLAIYDGSLNDSDLFPHFCKIEMDYDTVLQTKDLGKAIRCELFHLRRTKREKDVGFNRVTRHMDDAQKAKFKQLLSCAPMTANRGG